MNATRGWWVDWIVGLFAEEGITDEDGAAIGAGEILEKLVRLSPVRFGCMHGFADTEIPHDYYDFSIHNINSRGPGEENLHPQHFDYQKALVSLFPRLRPWKQYIGRHQRELGPKCLATHLYNIPNLGNLFRAKDKTRNGIHRVCVLYLAWLLDFARVKDPNLHRQQIEAIVSYHLGYALVCWCMTSRHPTKDLWWDRRFRCHGQAIVLFHALIYYE